MQHSKEKKITNTRKKTRIYTVHRGSIEYTLDGVNAFTVL